MIWGCNHRKKSSNVFLLTEGQVLEVFQNRGPPNHSLLSIFSNKSTIFGVALFWETIILDCRETQTSKDSMTIVHCAAQNWRCLPTCVTFGKSSIFPQQFIVAWHPWSILFQSICNIFVPVCFTKSMLTYWVNFLPGLGRPWTIQLITYIAFDYGPAHICFESCSW